LLDAAPAGLLTDAEHGHLLQRIAARARVGHLAHEAGDAEPERRPTTEADQRRGDLLVERRLVRGLLRVVEHAGNRDDGGRIRGCEAPTCGVTMRSAASWTPLSSVLDEPRIVPPSWGQPPAWNAGTRQTSPEAAGVIQRHAGMQGLSGRIGPQADR
jgi:hypothetical protein